MGTAELRDERRCRSDPELELEPGLGALGLLGCELLRHERHSEAQSNKQALYQYLSRKQAICDHV